MHPGDVSYALIQQGEKERLGKTPSSSSTTVWWWWRSAGLQQGFAKHYERRGGGGVGLRQQGEQITCVGQPQTSSIYRGRGGVAPPPRVPSLGVAARWRGEGGAPGMGPKAHLPLGFAPLLPLGALGPCGGGTSPPGAGGPTWWTHGTLPVVPVCYR